MGTHLKKRIIYLYICGCTSLLLTAFICLDDATTIHAIAAGKWSVTTGPEQGHPDDHDEYQVFVTPDDPSVYELAQKLEDPQLIYETAVEWIYVSEQTLNESDDAWQYPAEFLKVSPGIPTNPVPGHVAGDCEEQANTLASLLRAAGVPADNIRVVLGQVTVDKDYIRGHVWVEIYENDRWLALDPSQGPVWNDRYEKLVYVNGMSFDYYELHTYPVTDVSLYYNDVYYLDMRSGEGNAPDFWYVQHPR